MSRFKSSFYGVIVDGKIEFNNVLMVQEYCRNLPDKMPVKVTIERQYADPTKELMGYYFACIVKPASEESGYTKDEVDDLLCKEFLTEHSDTALERIRSKTELNVKEFCEFVEHSIRFVASNWGISVVPADTNWKSHK